MKQVVTHSGKFHTDDVLAYAILLKYFKNKESLQLIRSRSDEVIAKADIVFDVGGSYDPVAHRYDHHQVGRAGERTNTIPYAACGLIWKHFGKDLCSTSEVWSVVDEDLIQGVDAIDNGISLYSLNELNIKLFSIGNVIDCFLPVHEEASLEDFDAQFVKAAEFMVFVLESTIHRAETKIASKIAIEEVYRAAVDKQIIICEKYIPGAKKLLSSYNEPIFVIYPDQNNRWRVEGVRIDPNDFPVRKDLPSSWSGLRDVDFQKQSGVVDATFCHPGLFTAGAETMNGAVELAKKALLM